MDSVYIRRLELEDAEALLELRLKNRSFFRSYEPSHPESHFTLPAQIQAIQNVIENWQKDLGYGFGIFLQSSQQLIGRVNLSNVVRGAWQNCTIGYYLDRSFNGKGYMTEAVKQAVNFAFHEVDLPTSCTGSGNAS
ncbi:GNAT family N-acetyltransferase [Thermoflavimicrobium dichotomicum]|uniref:Ribosomal-protein-alanine N-acetyltransferase n=1 Tax=Thermoflavimicrobium dichotomicum TaxID=46223 RepID=A0A1I3T7R6_9BACL|nr:ribosomal-protein-alanine N-acetyltransferase [Thermoflavimicrobium dichotomicum]